MAVAQLWIVRPPAHVHMNDKPKEAGQWFVSGVLCHLVLLVVLFGAKTLVPDSWRGYVVIEGRPGGGHTWSLAPPAVTEVRDHDALLMGLVVLTSLVASLLAMWLSWDRRREFGLGFLVPAVWVIFYLL